MWKQLKQRPKPLSFLSFLVDIKVFPGHLWDKTTIACPRSDPQHPHGWTSPECKDQPCGGNPFQLGSLTFGSAFSSPQQTGTQFACWPPASFLTPTREQVPEIVQLLIVIRKMLSTLSPLFSGRRSSKYFFHWRMTYLVEILFCFGKIKMSRRSSKSLQLSLLDNFI